MEKQRQLLLNFMDEFDLTSSESSPRQMIENGVKIEKDKTHDHKAITASKIVNCISTKNKMTFTNLTDSPIKTERFDDWNEEKKYNRYRRDSDGSDSRERRGRSRSRERSRSRDRRGRSNRRFRQRSRSRDRCGRSNSRFRQRSRSRDCCGRSISRFRQRTRSRDRRGRSKSRFYQRSKSRDRHRSKDRDHRGRSKSIDKYYHDRSDRTERSEYSRSDRYTKDYIDKYNSSSREKYNNSSIDRAVSWQYDGRSDRSGSRVYKHEIKHERIDTYFPISYRDQYEVSEVMDYDTGSDKAFQLKNLTYKYKNNKPSSTVTSSDIQISAAHFNDTSHEIGKTEEAAESLKYLHTSYPQMKYENDRLEGMHSQYQMDEQTNPNNLQSLFSLPTIRVKRNPFATDVPYPNYKRNVSDYRSSINNNVELPKYQQSSSTNATATYGQHKQQNLQVAPSVLKIDISKSHLNEIYRSGEYLIPSTNSESIQRFRIPKKKPICIVTQDIHTIGNYSRAASENKQSDSADLQYELSGNIDQRPKNTTTIDRNNSKKPSPTEIQGGIVKASSSVLTNDQTAVTKQEEVESLFKTLINSSGVINPSSLVALINLCGKTSDDGKSNEMIQTPTTQTNLADISEQNDINLLTTSKVEKIVKVKKLKRKRMNWSSCRKSKRNNRSTKAASQNEANNPTTPSTSKNIKQKAKLKDDVTKPILRNADIKPKLGADVVKPKKRQQVESSEPESPKRLRKVLKSNKRMEPTIVADHLTAKRVKRAQMTKERDVTLRKLESSGSEETFEPSDSDESFSSTAGTRRNKNKKRKVGAEHNTLRAIANRRRLSANRKRIASEVVPELDSATPCRGLHTEDDENRQQFTQRVDVKPKIEPSTIKNNNPEWHCMNQRLECLHCDKNTGISLANHYVNKHPDCEVFPCRLSPDIAEFLRNTTQEHICERRKHADRLPFEFRQRCYFCDKFKLYTKNMWLQHVSVHTGCYEFQCKYCLSTFSAPKKDHDCTGKNNCVRKFKYPPFHRRDGIVYGYVCDLCNFIRFKQSEIEKHLRCEHDGEVDGKFRELVLLTFPKKKKKHEIKAEEEALKLAIKAATENKSLDPLISKDDDNIAIVIKTDDDYDIGQKIPKKEADIDTTRTIEENMPIVILDSDDSDCDDDWISCTDDDEISDNISNLQPSTSTQVGSIEILPEIIYQVDELIIKEESSSQTESLGEMSQQQNDVASSTTQSSREVPDANIEGSKSLIDKKIDATAYKKIVIEATTQADDEIDNIIATNLSTINDCSFTLNVTSNPESENGKCATESLNFSNMDDDTVDMNEFNFGTNVQAKTDSDPVTTLQQSDIQCPEIALTPSTLDETDFLKISCVTSLVQQSSSSPTPNDIELTDIAGISNEIFTNEEFMGIIEEMVGSPNTGMTFSDILENYEFETLRDQQLTSTQTAKTSMMQEIVELPDKTSKASTTLPLWTAMQLEIDNAAYNVVKGTGLTGSDLYRCCLTDCDEKYTDSSALEMHLLSHDQSHTNLKCYHCPMACKTIASLMHHIETHRNIDIFAVTAFTRAQL